MSGQLEMKGLFARELGSLVNELEDCSRMENQDPQVFYRLFHSIKSMAALGGLKGLENAAHDQETLLARGGLNLVHTRSFAAWARSTIAALGPEAFGAGTPAKRSPEKSSPSMDCIEFSSWPMEGHRLERLWTQLNRHKDIFCLSVWINCEAQEARIRTRLLQAKLESGFWLIDCRAWTWTQEGEVRAIDCRDENLAWEGSPVFFQAILLPTGGSRGSLQDAMPDQVDFWFSSVVDKEFFRFSPAENALAEESAILARHAAGNAGSSDPNLAGQAVHGLAARACQILAMPGHGLDDMIRHAMSSLFKDHADRIRLFLSLDRVSLPPRGRSVFLEVLLQLGRNIIAHGVENPAARKSRYKDPVMSVHVHLQRDTGGLSLVLWDDGPGLVLDDMERAAPGLAEGPEPVFPGLPGHVGQAWGDDVFLLLESGLEAHEEASLASGRGVGLSSAAFIVRNILQGQISCHSREGQGTCFHIRIPRMVIQARCALFAWREGIIAVPRTSLLDSPSGPVMVPVQSSPDRLEWAGQVCRMTNPLPVLELQEMKASGILDSRGRTGTWVGAWLGDEELVFPWDANSAYSSLASRWVELGDF